MNELSISEVARRAGVRTSTLRYYESIGLLPIPARVSGRRRYDASILQRLEIIRTAQQAGFTLAETRVLFDDILGGSASSLAASAASASATSTQWQSLIQRKLRELDVLLANVQSMKSLLNDILSCDGDALEECIVLTGQKYRTTLS